MHVVQPKKDRNKVVGQIDVWRLSTGHRQLPKGGTHRDRRRMAKVNSRASFRKEF